MAVSFADLISAERFRGEAEFEMTHSFLDASMETYMHTRTHALARAPARANANSRQVDIQAAVPRERTAQMTERRRGWTASTRCTGC